MVCRSVLYHSDSGSPHPVRLKGLEVTNPNRSFVYNVPGIHRFRRIGMQIALSVLPQGGLK